jgi:hypothetical protein
MAIGTDLQREPDMKNHGRAFESSVPCGKMSSIR